MNKKLFLILVLAVGVTTFSRSEAADPAAGKAKYDMFCAACHGPLGQGDGVASAALNPKPRNFSDKALMSKKTDADLKKIIQEGGAANGLSGTMPGWKASLAESDVDNIIAFIRSLAK